MPVEEQLFQASNKFKQTNQVAGIQALHDHVIVRDMNFGGRQLSSGIYLLNDDGKTEGIRPRWAQVYAVGPDQKDVDVGQWVLIEHGRWSRGLEVDIDGEEFTLRKADPKCIIFVSDEEPNEDDTISTAVMAERKSRTQFE
jgi:co-chaperonin GroES (HSP10)